MSSLWATSNYPIGSGIAPALPSIACEIVMTALVGPEKLLLCGTDPIVTD